MGKSILEKRNETMKLADHFNIDISRFQDTDSRGGSYIDDQLGLKRAIADAATSNASIMMSLHAGLTSGKKKAKDILDEGWSYKDLSGINNALNYMRKVGDRNDQGGEFSSANDKLGVTTHLVERDRRLHNEDIDRRIAEAAKGVKKPKKVKEAEPYVMSPRLANAHAGVNRFESLMNDFAFNGASPYGDGTPLSLKTSQLSPQFDTRASELGYEASNVVGSGQPIDTVNTSPLDNTNVLEGVVSQEVSPQASPAGFSQKFKDDYTFKVKNAMRKNGVKSSNFG